MLFEVKVNREFGRIVLRTDDSSVKYMFEFVIKETIYNKSGNRIEVPKMIKLYENGKDIKDDEGNYIFIFHYGWASYLLRVFKNYLSVPDYEDLMKLLMAESYRTIPFQELRDYQNSDVLHLLKYNIGLYSCFTSYGASIL